MTPNLISPLGLGFLQEKDLKSLTLDLNKMLHHFILKKLGESNDIWATEILYSK